MHKHRQDIDASAGRQAYQRRSFHRAQDRKQLAEHRARAPDTDRQRHCVGAFVFVELDAHRNQGHYKRHSTGVHRSPMHHAHRFAHHAHRFARC